MAIRPLNELDDCQLVNSDQDCRGWSVIGPAGTVVGTVREMLVDTDAERVTSLVLDKGDAVPVGSVVLRDGKVHVTETGAGEPARTPRSASTPSGERVEAGDEVVLPVIQEEIRIGKRAVTGGGVRVTTKVEERPVRESVSLREEKVNVSRRAADRAVASKGDVFEERSFEVNASSEEAVVDKQARVVEEVVVGKEVSEREAVIDDKVRRTDVEVTKLGPAKDPSSRPS